MKAVCKIYYKSDNNLSEHKHFRADICYFSKVQNVIKIFKKSKK